MSEWQPIETAPKDGRTRVIWWIDFKDTTTKPRAFIGYWKKDVKGFCVTDGDNAWHERGAVAWMSLPSPPKPEGKP